MFEGKDGVYDGISDGHQSLFALVELRDVGGECTEVRIKTPDGVFVKSSESKAIW